MPLSKYNKQFGGKPNAADEAMAAMQKEYGAKKGEQVFYATKNKKAGKKKIATKAKKSSRSLYPAPARMD